MASHEFFAPPQFQFRLQLVSDFAFADCTGTLVLHLRLIIGRGAPIQLFAGNGESTIRIGARLFEQRGSHNDPQRGALLTETRVAAAPFEARRGEASEHALILAIPPQADGPMVLEIDLVKEMHFWFSELGHPPLTLPIQPRAMIVRPEMDTAHDLARLSETFHAKRQREEHQEAVIFALLNQLRKRDT